MPIQAKILAASATMVGSNGKDMKPARMTADEKRIIREMHFEQGLSRSMVASLLRRNLSSICRLLAQKKSPAPVGAPRKLSEDRINSLVALLEKMVDEADATYEVSLARLMKRSRIKVSPRTVANALHARGYWFRDLRHKPVLTPRDVVDRYKFANKYKDMPKTWWLKKIHIHVDNHKFKVAATAKGRSLSAKRRVRGVCQTRGKSLRCGHVKPSPKLKLKTGAKGILKTGGVGGGKVLVWHSIDDRWCGDAAASMYETVMAPALRRQYPRARVFNVLEDNDPTGNTSKKV